ncbi:MAG TPA: metallophosphoesterase family protein [Polyangiaceae bacterium]|jgi:predicted phosphodiesterase
MLLLCVSDVHGNLDALRAVLATAERRSFHKLLVAGDIVFPGLDDAASAAPLETWRRLTAAGAVMVQGVTDRAIATLDPTKLAPKSEHEEKMIERMKGVRAELGDLVLERLRRLPTQSRFPLEDGGELLLVHGSPTDPSEAMTHDMSDEELSALIGDDPADVIVCGMSHVPFDRVVQGTRIVNVGSIGESPDGVAARAEPMVAHATWIESRPSGLVIEPIVVPLRERALKTA